MLSNQIREFLSPIFPNDVIDAILENGRTEYAEVTRRPHPYEFYLVLRHLGVVRPRD